jgi:hypothetical protein
MTVISPRSVLARLTQWLQRTTAAGSEEQFKSYPPRRENLYRRASSLDQ